MAMSRKRSWGVSAAITLYDKLRKAMLIARQSLTSASVVNPKDRRARLLLLYQPLWVKSPAGNLLFTPIFSPASSAAEDDHIRLKRN